MLTTPATSRGISDTVPLRSSILSMINIAIIDVKAIVIYAIPKDKYLQQTKTKICLTNQHHSVKLTGKRSQTRRASLGLR